MSYDFLVKENLIHKYINWAIRKYNIKLYTAKEYKEVNKQISLKYRASERL